jgi:uncharacterized protein YciI
LRPNEEIVGQAACEIVDVKPDRRRPMTDIGKEIQELITPNLRKRLYVALSFPNVPQEEMVRYLPEHLRYMAAAEERIFLSGLLIRPGQLVGEGLTVLNAESVAEATEFMRNEPLIHHGLRRFELKLWEVREGTMTFATKLSQRRFGLK